MKIRNLVIWGLTFKVGFSKSGARIWFPDNTTTFVEATELTGYSWEELDRSAWKGTEAHRLKPHQVKRWIQRNYCLQCKSGYCQHANASRFTRIKMAISKALVLGEPIPVDLVFKYNAFRSQ